MRISQIGSDVGSMVVVDAPNPLPEPVPKLRLEATRFTGTLSQFKPFHPGQLGPGPGDADYDQTSNRAIAMTVLNWLIVSLRAPHPPSIVLE